MKTLATKVFRPVGVLIVDDQQREAAVFVERLHARNGVGGRSNEICGTGARQALNTLRRRFLIKRVQG